MAVATPVGKRFLCIWRSTFMSAFYMYQKIEIDLFVIQGL